MFVALFAMDLSCAGFFNRPQDNTVATELFLVR